MKSFIILIFSFFYFYSSAQIQLEWEQDNYDSNANELHSFAIDDSGNCYLGGSWNEDRSYLLIKYNSAGSREWVAQYADTFGGWITDMWVDKFKNVYVTGSSWNNPYIADMVTIKYNSGGNEEWLSRFGPDTLFSTIDGFAESIAVDDSGNVYVLGMLYNNSGLDTMVLLKYTAIGQQLWIVKYGENQIPYDDGKKVIVFNGEYLYVGTNTGQSTGWKGEVLKYNLNGNLIWESELGNGFYQGMVVDKKGNAYLAENDSGKISITKFDSSGIKLWTKETDYGATIKHLILDGNEDIILTGIAFFYDGINFSDSLLIMKYSSDSSLLWKEIFYSNLWNEGYETATDKDNNIYVIARFDTSHRIFKLDKDGNELWSFPVKGNKIRLDSQNNIYVATVDDDFYVAKYSQLTGIHEEGKNAELSSGIYPNPFDAYFSIQSSGSTNSVFELYSLTGQLILSQKITSAQERIHASALPSGLYFYKITDKDGKAARGKVVKE